MNRSDLRVTTELRQTPLNQIHRKLGAKMVDFGGWDMPVEYAGLLEEHRTVRQRVGLFDVSHMGEIEIRGEQALALVQELTPNDASRLVQGQAQYSALLNENGGFIDDILVHKISDQHYFLCVNAANQDVDFAHIQKHNRYNAQVENAGNQYAQIAVQGPLATEVLQKLTATELKPIKRYHFTDGAVDGAPARIARTGYTGEDGWEIYIAPTEAARLWQVLLDAGKDQGIQPCGLGARNTLRMEAAMPLHGHEIDETITPFEAGLDWIVKLDKGEFLGRAVLLAQKATGIGKKLCGLEMIDRGIARDGYEVQREGTRMGRVTSGGPSPTLNKNIAMAYVPVRLAVPGQMLDVLIRDRAVKAVTVPLPFYKRAK